MSATQYKLQHRLDGVDGYLDSFRFFRLANLLVLSCLIRTQLTQNKCAIR